MSDIGNKFVIGKIGFELFGFDINDVTSVVEMKKITRVPGTPDYMEGVINLRGNVVPVMNLRKKLGFQSEKIDPLWKLIVIRTNKQDELGIIVDEIKKVVDILDINRRKIEKTIDEIMFDKNLFSYEFQWSTFEYKNAYKLSSKEEDKGEDCVTKIIELADLNQIVAGLIGGQIYIWNW